LRLKRKEAESDESHAAAAAFLADFCSTVASEGMYIPYFAYPAASHDCSIFVLQAYSVMALLYEILAIIV
jgi:hypothetical protein